MTQIAAVIQQLQKERERAAREVAQLDAALAALDRAAGMLGGTRTLSAAARDRIAAAQRARWARVKANTKEQINCAEKADAVGYGAQENRGRAASQVGKGEGGKKDGLSCCRAGASVIPNPQPNLQNLMSYTTSANFGSPAVLLSHCKT